MSLFFLFGKSGVSFFLLFFGHIEKSIYMYTVFSLYIKRDPTSIKHNSTYMEKMCFLYKIIVLRALFAFKLNTYSFTFNAIYTPRGRGACWSTVHRCVNKGKLTLNSVFDILKFTPLFTVSSKKVTQSHEYIKTHTL